jgi:amino acid adenylation domain-containing protein
MALVNQTDRPFPDQVTLPQLLEAQVARHPELPAVVCEHDKVFGSPALSFAQLNAKANQLARVLRSEGVAPGEIVGLMVERSFSMIIGILGILKAGAAYLPLSPENPKDRNAYMLSDCGVRVLLTQSQTAPQASFACRHTNLEDPGIYQGSTENLPLVSGPTDLAYVIYTSGSTGKPKGVMIEHRSVVNRLHWMQSAYPIGPGDVILQKTPYYFDVSVWELFWWALTGASVSFLLPGAERFPMVLIDTIRKNKVSVMHFVPSMLSVFLDYLDGRKPAFIQRLASVKRVFASGEALQPSHVRKFNTIIGGNTGALLTNLYGPTEATVDVSYFDCPSENDFEKIPIGRPIDNTRFYILDGERPTAPGEPGELCIAGVGLARGYMNHPELTAKKFTDNPLNPGERIYRTGDQARWLPDGNVEYLGRADNQVKIRGLRIELGEIENAIREYPSISDCVAIVKTLSESVMLIVAYVVARKGLDLNDLTKHLRAQLPEYMVPNHFQLIDQIPLGPTGKANRAALPDPILTSV